MMQVGDSSRYNDECLLSTCIIDELIKLRMRTVRSMTATSSVVKKKGIMSLRPQSRKIDDPQRSPFDWGLKLFCGQFRLRFALQIVQLGLDPHFFLGGHSVDEQDPL